MERALIVSHTEKSIAFFTEMLQAASCDPILLVGSGAEARRLLLEQEVDLVLINAPLRDESGETLAREIAGGGASQVLLVVRSGDFEAVSSVTEGDGVLTVAKPLNKALFWSALKLALAAQNRVRHLRDENSKLTQKIADIRMIDRAKCILISFLNISEQEAHRYIEKQAMDLRTTRRAVAEAILKTYEE